MIDIGWTDLLSANGHTVTRFDMEGLPNPDEMNAMDAADLVIVSRSISSTSFNHPTEWNSVTTPLLLMSPFLTRSSRWGWVDTTNASFNTGDGTLTAVNPNHPIFDGMTGIDMWDETRISSDNGIQSNGTTDVGNGTLLATAASTGDIWVAHWDTGVEFYTGSGQTAGGPRLFFSLGTAAINNAWGANNSTPEGEQIFLNAVDFMAPGPGVPGDFDADSDVDGADFLVWQRDLGDAVNLDLWKANFGTTAAAATAAVVPEPTSILLLGLGSLLIGGAVRRRS